VENGAREGGGGCNGGSTAAEKSNDSAITVARPTAQPTDANPSAEPASTPPPMPAPPDVRTVSGRGPDAQAAHHQSRWQNRSHEACWGRHQRLQPRGEKNIVVLCRSRECELVRILVTSTKGEDEPYTLT